MRKEETCRTKIVSLVLSRKNGTTGKNFKGIIGIVF
jgi:hypothetical protein